MMDDDDVDADTDDDEGTSYTPVKPPPAGGKTPLHHGNSLSLVLGTAS